MYIVCGSAIALGLTSLWLSYSLPATQQNIIVEGWVYDSKGGPLITAIVKAWQDDKPAAEDKTTSDGYYKLTLAAGKPVNRIEFTHGAKEPGEVLHLSGTKDHRISKILYAAGEPRSIPATLDQLVTYKDILLLAHQSGQAIKVQVIETIQKSKYISNLEKLPLPADATQAVQRILSSDKSQLVAEYNRLVR
jgi:hypothetical protein